MLSPKFSSDAPKILSDKFDVIKILFDDADEVQDALVLPLQVLQKKSTNALDLP